MNSNSCNITKISTICHKKGGSLTVAVTSECVCNYGRVEDVPRPYFLLANVGSNVGQLIARWQRQQLVEISQFIAQLIGVIREVQFVKPVYNRYLYD